jgi:hypothetical protein
MLDTSRRLGEDMSSLPRGLRAIGCLVLLASLALLAPRAHAGAGDQTRANFVLLLGKYVNWPETAFRSPNAPIVIAVIANPTLASELRRLAAGQLVNGRLVEVRESPDASGAASAHIAFVSDGAQSSALAEAKPLRVIEGGSELRRADIAIELHGGRVAFSVNRRQTAQRGLKLSSKLLRLASSFE